MADNKAQALKEAKNQCQLKVYYDGKSPADSGDAIIPQEVLDKNHRPWLVKFYLRDGYCYQFADTSGIYRRISQDISQVLDAVIVNNKQREALDKIVDKLLWGYLMNDLAHGNDMIADSCNY